MRVSNNTLILNNFNLKDILMHIALCAECVAADGGEVDKMEFIRLFKDELENQKWLNDLEFANYKRIEIEL